MSPPRPSADSSRPDATARPCCSEASSPPADTRGEAARARAPPPAAIGRIAGRSRDLKSPPWEETCQIEGKHGAVLPNRRLADARRQRGQITYVYESGLLVLPDPRKLSASIPWRRNRR